MNMRTTRLVAIAFLAIIMSHTVLAQPTITSVTPGSTKPGRSVIITGTGFNATPANNKVYFGAVAATVLSGSTTSLRVRVPAQANYRAVSVTNTVTSLTAYSRGPFTVTFNPSATVSAGSFGGREDFPLSASPQATAFGDFDGDGKPDMATICYNANSLVTYLNISTVGVMDFLSGFQVSSPVGAAPNELAIGDIDGDGKLDVVVSNFNVSTISVLRNTSTLGNISFAAKVDSSVGNSPSGVAIVDLDKDGKPDVVVINLSDGTFSVLRNTSTPGNISFAPQIVKIPDLGGGSVLHSVASGDFDGDGKPDLAMTDVNFRQVIVWRNTSTPGTILLVQANLLTYNPDGLRAPLFIAVGDIDLDGKPDIAISDTTTSLFISRNISSGVGNFDFSGIPAQLTRGAGLGAVTLADIDGDGRPDIATGNSTDNTVSIFINRTTPGSITSSDFLPRINTDVTSYPIRIAVCDIDGDGHPDIAAPGFTGIDVSVVQNLIPDGYVRANIKAILQGPYVSAPDSMSRTLNSGGALATRFGAGKAPTLAVDSVNVELRNNSNPAIATIRRFVPAWIQTNGTMRLFADTTLSFVEFDSVAAGSYFLVVRHRNHLGIMSVSTVPLTIASASYDFTTAQAKAFGSTPMIQVGTKFCMFAGDGNATGIVTAADANLVFVGINGTGYLSADGNLSGIVTAADANIVFINLNASTKVP